jgi:hypothetical protein
MPKKQAKQGIASWRIVDSALYCYHLIWEADLPSSEFPISERILEALLTALPRERTFDLYIDAGTLGGWEITRRLLRDGHHFIICHAANRPAWLFSGTLHNKDHKPAEGKTVMVSNGKVMAVTWNAPQKNKPSKLVNFTTNMPGLLGASAVRHKAPVLADVYNKQKCYVDLLKSSFNKFALQHRTTRLWKHKFIAILFLMVHNGYVIWRALQADSSKATKADFIYNLMLGLASPDERRASRLLTPPSDALSALLHVRTRCPKRGTCYVCKTARVHTYCMQCPAKPALCTEHDCFLVYHFPELRNLRQCDIPQKSQEIETDV